MNDFVNNFVWEMLANLVALSVIGFTGWHHFRKQHLHTLRIGLFSELMGHRYNVKGDPFTAALNQVLVLFNDDQDVVRTARDFSQRAKNQTADHNELVKLLRAICRNLKISEQTITDDDFTTAFNVQSGPMEVVLKVQQVLESSYPQVAVCGYRLPNPIPESIAVLDAEGTQLILELQRHLASAQARFHPGRN